MKPLPEVQLQHGATAKSVHIAGDPTNRTTLDGAYQFQLAYIHKGISVNFTNVDFVRGAAPGTGAGKYANYQNGGSLINDGGVMRVVNASFRDRTPRSSSGAIHNTNAGQLHVEHATFTNCTAHSGGAISSTSTMSTSTNTLATIVDANFSDNHATGLVRRDPALGHRRAPRDHQLLVLQPLGRRERRHAAEHRRLDDGPRRLHVRPLDRDQRRHPLER